MAEKIVHQRYQVRGEYKDKTHVLAYTDNEGEAEGVKRREETNKYYENVRVVDVDAEIEEAEQGVREENALRGSEQPSEQPTPTPWNQGGNV